jgi:hypothetical protein
MAVICFIIAWYEEIEIKQSEEEDERKEYMGVMFFVLSMIFFFFSAFAFLSVTNYYYYATTDSYVQLIDTSYMPFGYAMIMIGMLCLLISMGKGMQLLINWKEE